MTYDWEPYKEVCHRVYVEEKQSLRKLHAYLKNNHGFEPSLRGLHHRLQQWNFPPKHNPAYKNEALVARIKELWETNHQMRDMITILTDEGFEIQEREINRIRQKNRWLLRLDVAHLNKKKPNKEKRPAAQATSPESDSDDFPPSEGEREEDNQEDSTTTPNFEPVTPSAALADMDFTQAQGEAFQEARKRALAADAEEKRVTKKRRRWLKGRAGLPADPPGPPRFPSELSLTECKAVLAMDTPVYKDVRAKFRKICEAEGIVKKTIAGPQKWEAVKLQLVRESMHLRGVFWDQLNMEQKNLALDLICSDVTKGIRSEGSRMMLHEARNILGLNPKIGREVRFHFQKILAEDHFKGKIVAGEEHWNELVRRWLAESEVLGPVATSLNELDPEYAKKKKAVQCIASDAMKRFRDAELRGTLRKIPNQPVNATPQYMPTPTPAPVSGSATSPAQPHVSPTDSPSFFAPEQSQAQTEAQAQTQAGARAQVQAQTQAQGLTPAPLHASSPAPPYTTTPTPAQAPPSAQPYRPPTAIYFRLNPASTVTGLPGMWIATLTSRSIEELRSKAASKSPGAVCMAVDGIVRDGLGGEVPIPIPGNTELEAYLEHMAEVHGPPTFSVQLINVS
ncbi:hypothetical protein GE09DRAFT_1022757 [Coniochaeta sp. 2T2.1]|nr:hypothetical protein GE09DRAFT_1022757 [Coniochaeta sp. 2T2.1]